MPLKPSLMSRFFKFYFAMMLIGFVIAVLLMNIPRLLASELVPQTLEHSIDVGNTSQVPVSELDLKNPLKVQMNELKPGELAGTGQFLEYRGTKLNFTIRF